MNVDQALALLDGGVGLPVDEFKGRANLFPASSVTRNDIDPLLGKGYGFHWEGDKVQEISSNAVVDGKIVSKTFARYLLYVRGNALTMSQTVSLGEAFQHKVVFSTAETSKPQLCVLSMWALDGRVDTLEFRCTPFTGVPPIPWWLFEYSGLGIDILGLLGGNNSRTGQQSTTLMSLLSVTKIEAALNARLSPILAEKKSYPLLEMKRNLVAFGSRPAPSKSSEPQNAQHVCLEFAQILPVNMEKVFGGKMLSHSGFDENTLRGSLPVVALRVGQMSHQKYSYSSEGERHKVKYMVRGRESYVTDYDEVTKQKGPGL